MYSLVKYRCAPHLVFGLVAAVVGCDAACTYTAVRTDTAIAVDGVVESAWDAVPSASLNNYLQGQSCAANDFSGSWRATWNETTNQLYVLVEVNDETLKRDSGGAHYEDDNVEIYLDGDNSKEVGTGWADSGYDGINDFQIRYLPFDGGITVMAGDGYTGPGGLPASAYQVHAAGYTYEMVFDLDHIGVGSITPGVTRIGFDLHISDDDDGGNRDHKFAWCATVDDSWYNPASFGTMEFTADTGNMPDKTLTLLDDGNGSVSASPAKSSYLGSESVTLTAVPAAGYLFSHWSGDLSGSENPDTLLMNDDRTVTAHFVERPAGSAVFAMNCGGSLYVASDSDVYDPNGYSNPRSSARVSTHVVSGTDDPELYKTWQTASTKLIYAIPLPNGYYEVDLMWATPSSAPARMDVSVAGTLVEDDLNVVQAAGGVSRALVRTYPAIVADGELRIVLFRSTAGEPFINAIEVRPISDPEGNQPPVILTVDQPGVIGSPVTFCSCDFSASFFDRDGDALAAIEIAAAPVYGSLRLDGSLLQQGDTVAFADLDRLQYHSLRTAQGRDHWQWRAFDGTNWSERSAGVHVFLRAAEDRVDNLRTAPWQTFSWPLFAYYEPGNEGDFGVVRGGDGVWRYGNACGPTARTHVNFFWKYPRQGTGSLSFVDNEGQTHDLAFAGKVYNYDAMPENISGSAPESVYGPLAQLMYDNDVLPVDIWYNGANAWEPMIPYHGFDGRAHTVNRDIVGEAAWIEALKKELNMGRLLQIEGLNASGGGHWWNISGYNALDEFYSQLNFGGYEGYYPNGNFRGYINALRIMTHFQPANLGQVSLYAPAGGPVEQRWFADTPKTIRWSAPNAQSVDLEYTLDDGLTWTTIAAGVDASLGQYAWTTPDATSGAFMVRVTDASDLNSFDQSEPIALVPVVPITLTLEVEGQGTVTADPQKSVYTADETVTLTAVAGAGFVFSHWEGDVSGSQNPLSLTMDQDISVTAVFNEPRSIVDEFAEWMAGFSSLSEEQKSLLADPDDDGLPNILEFINAEGHPAIFTSCPDFVPDETGDWVQIEWPLRQETDASLLLCEISTDPTSGVYVNAKDVAGVELVETGTVLRLRIPLSMTPRFVRFRIILPE